MFKPYGVIPPVISPMHEDGSFNEPVYRVMIDRLIDNGVHGIFPLGTTGEFYAFSVEQSRRILEITMDQVAHRVPVYAGANSITTRGAVELVQMAQECKVDAVSVLTPMFISQTQSELYGFYKTIAANTDLPVIIYNNRPKTNVTVEPGTIAQLSEIDNIVGVKDSTGDFTNTEEYLRLTRGNDNFGVLLGRDTLIYAGLCYGAVGAIASCANVAPRIAADIYDKYVAGDLKGSLEAQFALAPLRIASNMGTFPEVIKEGLILEGIPVGKCLDPIALLSDSQRNSLRGVLSEMGLL
ncbi:dihydrodipicolinate synthase family protein [uncultured Sphaerochaeta sp.]|uniref:dihydrodipicolinate synthase family protein n=1 Tax=uncultured Sphaerochaeta sp. TaxID=886478 RepID=UPI002A0A11B7|nr:dihydrodipicolinate synthase family protein [uncultured Sphaerochaeta sp.]